MKPSGISMLLLVKGLGNEEGAAEVNDDGPSDEDQGLKISS